MSFKYVPNILSITRIILTIPIMIVLLKSNFTLTLILFVIASITDALDGLIAKRFRHQSWLGSILDPLADKILLVSLFIGIYILGLAPLWLLTIVLLRDIILIAGIVGYYYEVGINEANEIIPSTLSKVNTFLQTLTVSLVIIAQLYPVLLVWVDLSFIIVATSTILSGIDYAWVWIKKALK